MRSRNARSRAVRTSTTARSILASPARAAVESLEGRQLFSTAFAVTTANQLVSFETTNPAAITSSVAITGMQVGEDMMAIDFRPTTGELYGIGATQRIYLINRTTGVATQQNQFNPQSNLFGNGFDLDFDATLNSNAGARFVSSTGESRVYNVTDGFFGNDTPLTYNPADVNLGVAPNVVAGAYTKSFPGSFSNAYYGIDSSLSTLVKLDEPNTPSNGQLTTVGPLGVDADNLAGFDITASGRAFASMNVGGVAKLYSVNLNTGGATLVGNIGNGVTPIRDVALFARGATLRGLHFNSLTQFHSGAPEQFGFDNPISSFPVGTQFRKMDYRPATGELYALAFKSNGQNAYDVTVRKIDNGPSTQVGNSPILTNVPSMDGYGFNFDPVSDRIRITTPTGQNLRVNPDTGAVNNDTSLSGQGQLQVVAIAYDHNVAGSQASACFGINKATNSLVRIGGGLGGASVNGGAVYNIGSLGITIGDVANTSFDIVGIDGTALLAAKDPNSQAINLYEVNLTTGAATSTGIINSATGTQYGMSAAMPGQVRIAQANYSVKEGTFTSTITVERVNGLASEPFAVDVNIADGSATFGSDYGGAATRHIEFAPNEKSKTFVINIVNDPNAEPDETVMLSLANATLGAVISPTQGTSTLTIQDNDQPSQAPVAVNDNYSTLQGQTLTVAAPGVLGNDSDPNGDPMTFQYIVAPAHGQLTPNPNGSFVYKPQAAFTGIDTFTYRVSDNQNNQSQIAAVQIAVTPPGGIQSSFAINDAQMNEGNSGAANMVFTVTRSGDLSFPASVQYTTANGAGPTGAVAGSDYASAANTLNFLPFQTTATISVAVVGDPDFEADEQFVVNLTGSVNASLSDAQGVGTIKNDDDLATVPVLNSITVGDGGLQRSQVKGVTLSFDRPVALVAGAVHLGRLNTGGSGVNDGSAPTDASAVLGAPASNDGGKTWVFTFVGGNPFMQTSNGNNTGSLVDGTYRLDIDPAKVTANGVAMAAPAEMTFHRLFGDVQGSKTVNTADFGAFRLALGKTAGQAGFDAALDFDNNGTINSLDFGQFRNRFGKGLQY